jgi:hypothetical protein
LYVGQVGEITAWSILPCTINKNRPVPITCNQQDLKILL